MNAQRVDAQGLRIGVLSRGVYPRLVGGREVFIRALVEGLAHRGCKVVLVTENGVGETIPGVREIALPTPDVAGLDLFAYSAAFARDGLLGMRGVDLVHVHSPGANIVLGAWAARILGVPLAVTVHSMAAAGSRWMWALRHSSALIAVSPSVRDRLVSAGAIPSRIWVIPSASTHPGPHGPRSEMRARLGFDSEDVVFLYHGRLVEGKGLEDLAEAFASLSGRKARLLIVGDGPMRRFLQSRLAASIADGRSVLVGTVPHEAIWSYLTAADVAVLPSRSEGSPLALFEALSAGLPVLAADAPGLRDFVTDGDNGVLSPGGNPKRIREGMERLLDDETLRRRLADNALRSGRLYTMKACVDRHLEVYRALTGSQHTSG